MTSWLRVLLLSVAMTAGCSVRAGGPPQIDVDRTACRHCGMLISETLYAAAYQAPGSEARVFDEIGCLLDAAREETNIDDLRFWFHDAAGGGWIDGPDAVFVKSEALRTPMGGGLIAYRDLAAAQRAAVDRHGRVVHSLRQLLAESKERKERGAS